MNDNTKKKQWALDFNTNPEANTDKSQISPSSFSSLNLLTNEKNTFISDEIHQEESLILFSIQAFVPFVLAGYGMVIAGVLTDHGRKQPLMTKMPEFSVLIIALLGLKGNLEMTLASRLSTMINLCLMKTLKQQLIVLISNVALVQVQAIVVSFVASVVTILITLLEGNIFDITRATNLTVTAISTASVASFVLTILIVLVTIVANNFGINPDNIATPFAAATGDVTTLLLLLRFGSFFCDENNGLFIFNMTLIIFLSLLTFVWVWIASKQESTLQVLKFGWFAILLAVLISSCGGYVLYFSSMKYENAHLLQIVINGAGGNLVAIQASKISTQLHSFGKKGVLPANTLSYYFNPLKIFFSKERESSIACILLLMCLPGHITFILFISFIKGAFQFDFLFLVLYGIITLIQVSILLYICQFLTRLIWKMNCNPDNNSIPLLTSIGDLLGTILLTAAFFFYFLMKTNGNTQNT